MLTLLGWIVLVIFGVGLTGSWFAVLLNCGGQYNIGGVPNTWKDRVLVIVTLVLLVGYWYWVATIAPFTISMNTITQ